MGTCLNKLNQRGEKEESVISSTGFRYGADVTENRASHRFNRQISFKMFSDLQHAHSDFILKLSLSHTWRLFFAIQGNLGH